MEMENTVGDALSQFLHAYFQFIRSVTTMSSTVQSAGSTGSWVEAVMVDKWPRSSCRSTARAGPKMAPSWCGRARHLLATTPSHSGQLQNTAPLCDLSFLIHECILRSAYWSCDLCINVWVSHLQPVFCVWLVLFQALRSSPTLQDPLTSGVRLHPLLPDW